MWWNYLSIHKLERCNRWSLGMDKSFHPPLYQAIDCLSMLGLTLNHASKRRHWCFARFAAKTAGQCAPKCFHFNKCFCFYFFFLENRFIQRYVMAWLLIPTVFIWSFQCRSGSNRCDTCFLPIHLLNLCPSNRSPSTIFKKGWLNQMEFTWINLLA